MRSTKLLLLIILPLPLLSSCTTANNVTQKTEDFVSRVHVSQNKSDTFPPVIPNSVKLTSKQKIHSSYQVLGTVTVSRYNWVGNKRQEATIEDIMQAKASKIGGNAVIHIRQTQKNVLGTIIRIHK